MKNGNTTMQQISRFGVPALSAGLFVAFMGVILGPANPTQAALVEGGKGPQLLIGLDDDRQDNAAIQAGAGANQSLNRTDILDGGQGNDVMFGFNGNDVMDGGPGRRHHPRRAGRWSGARRPPEQRHHVWRTRQRRESLGSRRWKRGVHRRAGARRDHFRRDRSRGRLPIRQQVSGCRPFYSVFRGFLRAYPQRT